MKSPFQTTNRTETFIDHVLSIFSHKDSQSYIMDKKNMKTKI